MRSAFQKCDIRFGFGVIIENDWILHADMYGAPQFFMQEFFQITDASGMRAAYRTHFDDFSMDELNAIIFGKNPCVSEALILPHVEQPLRDLDCHITAPRDNFQSVAARFSSLPAKDCVEFAPT